ncbi:terminase family protein [Victivallis sp. Marseille-Q1083]|uniref:terminase large subunit domain-containing protein n=1 Tax=Victivallis sp. Marseille-Q1083 TaxID=2717288 RepID=UPI00158EDE94|nr:terminase family protein [Victivallis sp. Marseille-Q1083]
MKYSETQKAAARSRYFDGETVEVIADALAIERRTLYNWIRTGGWRPAAGRENVDGLIECRISQLLRQEEKSLPQLLELERLLEHVERRKLNAARLADKRRSAAAAESDAEPAAAAPPETAPRKKRGRKPGKNDFTAIDEIDLMDKFRDGLFAYQLQLWEKRRERTRNILKSRQIGLTWYFAREAFTDALLTGRNKIFISASRAQSEIFKDYIRELALEWFEIDLKGSDKIVIHTPHGVATLYFLSTNSATGQGRHGDVYIDEYFWIPNFSKVKKLVGASSAQAQWSRTFFSTPSATTHEAYPFWTGDEYNERNRKTNKKLAEFPGRKELRDGFRLCPDGQWRTIITLDDAERMGCTLFNRADLELEYSPEEFRQLFGCEFIDDAGSVFSFSQLCACLGDKNLFPPGLDKQPVWIGYDPSRNRDGACIVVVAPPGTYRGTFHVIEKITLHDVSWPAQADFMKGLTKKYHVQRITMDATGPGSGVSEYVQLFFPRADGIVYTPEQKNQLVLKAQQVIGDGRIKWDASWSDIAAGFLQVKRAVGAKSDKILYYANRSEKTGHADAAWAIMQAISNEGLILPDQERKSRWSIGA